jgi:hypothetical protein
MKEDKQKEAAIIAGALLALGLFVWLYRKRTAELYTCPYCGAQFSTEEELLHHIQQEHPQQPPASTTLLGTVMDSSSNAALPSVKITLDSMTTQTDTSGNYVFYGLIPDTTYTITLEKEHYNTITQSITLKLGQNVLDILMEPVYIASVTIGIRTRASPDNITTPSGSYLSRPLMAKSGYWPVLLGSGYIPNTSSYTDYTVICQENPITGAKWKETDLSAYLFGVWLWASVGVTGETRCTQIWVEALYSDGTKKILRPYDGPGWEKVADVVPDEDQSYISYTTSGGPIPDSGGYFKYLVR